ncbi:hypothetical protein [Acidovorax radicis]|uniref:hypothetical protein n=1 Tax=Acidovorax radicis TaxID=758826 RepID=UPI0002376305|nr:hypothetical protein [Acidovorax radicis]
MSTPTPTFLRQALYASAAAWGLVACLPASASELDDGSVFYCPPVSMAADGAPTKGIMCNAQHCFNSQTPGLSKAQTNFLLTTQGQCRTLSAQEITDFWPKDLASGTQHAVK